LLSTYGVNSDISRWRVEVKAVIGGSNVHLGTDHPFHCHLIEKASHQLFYATLLPRLDINQYENLSQSAETMTWANDGSPSLVIKELSQSSKDCSQFQQVSDACLLVSG
jgi:hypothetical protein